MPQRALHHATSKLLLRCGLLYPSDSIAERSAAACSSSLFSGGSPHATPSTSGSHAAYASASMPALAGGGWTKPAQQQQQPSEKGSRKGRGGEGEINPRLKRIIDMLLPPEHQNGPPGAPVRGRRRAALAPTAKEADLAKGPTDEEREQVTHAAFRRIQSKHRALVADRQQAWEYDMQMKHALQQLALRALPKALRVMAQAPDTSPFPMNRQFLLQTPPKAYAQADVSSAAGARRAAGGQGGKEQEA